MRFVLLPLAAFGFASLSPAHAQTHADLQSMYFAHGSCQRLVTPDGDQSANCNTTLVLVSYSNGRHSFWFSVPNKSVTAFSGLNEQVEGDKLTLQLDLLTTASDPKAIRGGAGTGTCIFSDPWKGVAHVRCSGASDIGNFSAEFTTDGNTPDSVVSQ